MIRPSAATTARDWPPGPFKATYLVELDRAQRYHLRQALEVRVDLAREHLAHLGPDPGTDPLDLVWYAAERDVRLSERTLEAVRRRGRGGYTVLAHREVLAAAEAVEHEFESYADLYESCDDTEPDKGTALEWLELWLSILTALHESRVDAWEDGT